MERIHPNCAGLDVHKKFVTACRLTSDAHGHTAKEIRQFSTMTEDLEALADWLAEGGCTHVAMESTGVYWQPIYNILEDRFTILLVNPRDIKYVEGRKTDIQDAQWLAELMQLGLLKASFIAPREQRELRDVVRYRLSLVQERTRIVNRLQKQLEDANIKLASVATDIQGASAQAMLRELLAGRDDPKALAEMARGRMRAKQAELEKALKGKVREHHRFMLAHLLSHLGYLDEEIAALEARIEELLAKMPPFQEAVTLLDTIPGVDRQGATLIVAEIGVDMSRFPTDRHLTAWAGLAPGNNETGGKRRPAKARKGNRYLRAGTVQMAHGAARKKDCYLRSFYHRLAARRGKARAAVAVGRTILQIGYHLIARKQTYQEMGADYFDRLDRERTVKRLVRRLENLGLTVEVKEQSLAAAA